MRTIWKLLAWVFVVCGIIAYVLSWIAITSKPITWTIPTEYLFYDAMTAGIFGIFFLVYGTLEEGLKKKEK